MKDRPDLPGLLTEDCAVAWSSAPVVDWDGIHARIVYAPSGSTFPPRRQRIKLRIAQNPRLSFAMFCNTWVLPTPAKVIIQDSRNVDIHETAVIGSEGFGYERDPDGDLQHFPHYGNVTIGPGVSIGAHTCIDRGSLTDTRIDSGAKIDNLVHIAHGVHIKEQAVVVAHALICGSAVIGSGAWIGGGAIIKEGIKIGDGAVIGLGAVVTKDVPHGETWAGIPARAMQ